MYNFRAKSNIVLGLLSLLALMAFIAVENGKVNARQEYYNEKLAAAELSQRASEYLRSHRLEKGVFIDVINDPNQTALIGQKYTMITTDRGDIEAKLSSTNPNFAAVIVQLLKEAGLREGETVAVAFSGSFPGINISVLSALEVLKLKPIVITSVGASNYGANDPYFTWLDMERLLNEGGILSNRSLAASMGGGYDVGRGLSPMGRDLIIEAIHRNKVEYIDKEHLEEGIQRRMEIYDEQSKGRKIKAYINVGGGIASLGNTVNGEIIEPGLTEYLPMRNYPVKGTIIQMGQNGVPIIHMLNIAQLLAEYGLPNSPVPLPEPGEGGVFVREKYSLTITGIATFILVLVIILVYLGEQKYHRLGTDVVPLTQNQNQREEKEQTVNVLDL